MVKVPVIKNASVKKTLFGKFHLIFQCSGCNEELSSEIEDIGEVDYCPKCGEAFVLHDNLKKKVKSTESLLIQDREKKIKHKEELKLEKVEKKRLLKEQQAEEEKKKLKEEADEREGRRKKRTANLKAIENAKKNIDPCKVEEQEIAKLKNSKLDVLNSYIEIVKLLSFIGFFAGAVMIMIGFTGLSTTESSAASGAILGSGISVIISSFFALVSAEFLSCFIMIESNTRSSLIEMKELKINFMKYTSERSPSSNSKETNSD